MAENRKFWQKIGKYSKEQRGVNIDQIALCCLSMDSSQRALQTDGKPFLKFKTNFRNFDRKPKNIQTNREA